MLASKENIVKIEGILSEVNLKYGTLSKDGKDQKSVGGSITIRVDQVLPSGEKQVLEIPVYMYSTEYTKAGTINPAYKSIEDVMNKFTSIAASDIDHADRVRITKGEITMNEYYGQNGNLVSFPRIRASFVSKINAADCHPQATFSVIFMVANKGFEINREGIEDPNRYKITGVIPKWGGKVDVVPFVAVSEGVISAVSQYWEQGDTVRASGRLNFTSTTQIVKTEVDFGEPVETSRTINVSDLVITGGSQTPLDESLAFDPEEVKAALKVRQADLDASKEKAATKAASAPKNVNSFADLGF